MALEIVGRDEELAALREFMARGADGPAALVLSGEAGIGKSTLWLAGVEVARERSLRVLAARPAEAEQGLAHAGLGDLLAADVAEVLPELPAPRRRALEAALLLDGGDDGSTADPRALAVAVHSALAALSDRGTIVLAVDDVQWLDPSSAQALAFALRRLEREPVKVLLALRNDRMAELELALPESTKRLEVGALSLGAIQGLVRSELDRSFPRPTMLRLHEVSGGNPFYALELARALDAADAPLGSAQPLPVPQSLERLVGDRLRALPEETRAALLVVAVVGAPDTPLLEAAGIAAQTLVPAVAAQVLELPNGTVRFAHPLLASAVIAEATDAERRAAHRLAAGAVHEPVARARHVAAALEAPDGETARSLEQASALARARGAPAIAGELGEAAARSTPRDREDDRRSRIVRAARDHLAAGSAERAFALARELLEHATPGRARAETLALLGELEGQAGDIATAVGHLREALRESDGRPELELLIHEQLAHGTRISEGLVVAAEHARAAVRLGEQLHSEAATARALAALAIVRFNSAEPDSFVLAKRAVKLARSSGDASAIREASVAWAHCLVWSGRTDEARSVLVARLAEVGEQDEPAAADALWYLALVEERAGNLSLAREHAERSRDLTLQYAGPEREDDPGVVAPLARVAAFQGDEALARELSERACADAEARGGSSTGRFHLALLGILDRWSGDPVRALERFEAVDESRRASGFAYPIFVHLADQVEALLEVGRAADALELLEVWESQSRKLGHRRAIADIVRCRGLVAAREGNVFDALALLEEAAALHGEVGDPFGRARALLLLGITRRRARQKRAAREAIEGALAEFEEIGAAGWAERARAELGKVGGRTREDGLTPAEQRVAALVATGRTNREVAAALFLGERTVETHLSHIYAKLGIRSRTELARTLR